MDWTFSLILLSIRCTLKQDLKCTLTQLVYGATLRLPGQLFTPSSIDKQLDPTIYANWLSSYMQQLHRVSPCPQSPAFHVPSNLYTCTHVFVSHDAVRKPLDPPYDGPYKVLCRQAKCFVLDINGHRKTTTINSLKPAFLESHLLPANSLIPLASSSAP